MEFGHFVITFHNRKGHLKYCNRCVSGCESRLDPVTPQIQENSEIALASATPTPTLNCWWKVLHLLDWQRYYYRGSRLCVKLVYNGCEEDVSGEKRECEGRGRMPECNYAGTWVSLRVYHPKWALQCILMRRETQEKRCSWKTIFILAIFFFFPFFYSYFSPLYPHLSDFSSFSLSQFWAISVWIAHFSCIKHEVTH